MLLKKGFGRTGKLFATEYHPNFEPDILVMAKGLASGFPLSAVAAPAILADSQAPGTMGGTYTGNVVACAAAVATQNVIRDEGLVERSRDRGKKLWTGLLDLQDRYDVIRDVRGSGWYVVT